MVERTVRWCKRKPAISTAIVLAIALIVGLPVASSFAKVLKIPTFQSMFGTIASDAAKHFWGNNLNDEVLDPIGHTGQDKLYVMASRAMLRHLTLELEQPGTEAHTEMLADAQRDYEELANELTSTLQQSPSDAMRFALADCLTQLARYSDDDPTAMQQHCKDAESQLANMSAPSSLSIRLLAHVRELRNQAYILSLSQHSMDSDERTKKAADRMRATLARATKTENRSIDMAEGLVRFEFSDDETNAPLTNERVIAAHSKLTQQGRAQGAKAYIKLGFELDQTDVEFKLSSRDRQQLFTDLTLLSERILGNKGNAATTTLPIDSWPEIWVTDPRGVYDTILGIALAKTDAANREFQLE